MSSVDLLLNYGIDHRNGIVDLTGPVDDVMYKRVYMALSLLSHATKTYEQITFMLNTEGGDFYTGNAIYDIIRLWGGNTKIVCNGLVASAGAVILQAATDRVAMPNCQFLVHYGEDSNDSTTTARHNREMTTLMRNILHSRATVKRQTVNRWLSKESWFNADEALKSGLIDRIADE